MSLRCTWPTSEAKASEWGRGAGLNRRVHPAQMLLIHSVAIFHTRAPWITARRVRKCPVQTSRQGRNHPTTSARHVCLRLPPLVAFGGRPARFVFCGHEALKSTAIEVIKFGRLLAREVFKSRIAKSNSTFFCCVNDLTCGRPMEERSQRHETQERTLKGGRGATTADWLGMTHQDANTIEPGRDSRRLQTHLASS